MSVRIIIVGMEEFLTKAFFIIVNIGIFAGPVFFIIDNIEDGKWKKIALVLWLIVWIIIYRLNLHLDLD